jgi:hypothetical protein
MRGDTVHDKEEIMAENIRKWLLSGSLSSLMALGAAAGFSLGQNPTEPNEPKPGTTADIKEDTQEIKGARANVHQDEEKLEADLKQFGKGSPQVKADRKQLRADRLALKKLLRDRRRDRLMREHREERREEGHEHRLGRR